MDPISTYFDAERAESLLFIVAGVVALAVSAWCLLVRRRPFARGMALTLSAVAVLHLIVGLTVYQRSPHDAARMQQMVQSAPERIQADEVPRMRVVMRNFQIYLGVEVLLVVLGLVAIRFAPPGGFLRGAATGLALQAAWTAVLDVAATRRGGVYLSWLLTQT